jgi:1-acyl-sn-glycerol-3-phosphate acyltransferase
MALDRAGDQPVRAQFARRRHVAGAFSRAFLRAAGIPFAVKGRERLPSDTVRGRGQSRELHRRHRGGGGAASRFCVRDQERDGARAPGGLLLRRLGSEFVERFNRHKGASDARRVLRLAATGQSLVFFPEGTFNDVRQDRQFLGGAFTTARVRRCRWWPWRFMAPAPCFRRPACSCTACRFGLKSSRCYPRSKPGNAAGN